MPEFLTEAAASPPSSPAAQPIRQVRGLGGGSFPSPHSPSAVSGAEEGARCVCPAATAPFLEPTRAGLAPKGERAPSWDSRCARNDCLWFASCSSSLGPARPLCPDHFSCVQVPPRMCTTNTSCQLCKRAKQLLAAWKSPLSVPGHVSACISARVERCSAREICRAGVEKSRTQWLKGDVALRVALQSRGRPSRYP